MKLRCWLTTLSLCIYTTINAQNSVVKLLKSHFTSSEATEAKLSSDVNYMTAKEKQFIFYMNLCRLYPKKFSAFYLDYLRELDEQGYKKLKRKDKYYYSLYKDLKKQHSLPALQPDKKMFDLAKCWAMESGERGVIGHNRKRCKKGYAAECCSYSGIDDPMYFLLNLLVDETVTSLGHRKAILHQYKYAGVSIQKHRSHGYCVVVDFSY